MDAYDWESIQPSQPKEAILWTGFDFNFFFRWTDPTARNSWDLNPGHTGERRILLMQNSP